MGRTRSPAAVKIQGHKTTIRHVNSEQAQPKGIMDRTFYFIITVPEKNSYFSEGEKRRPEMRLRFAGYINSNIICFYKN